MLHRQPADHPLQLSTASFFVPAVPVAAERSLRVLSQLFTPLPQQRGMDFMAPSDRGCRGPRPERYAYFAPESS